MSALEIAAVRWGLRPLRPEATLVRFARGGVRWAVGLRPDGSPLRIETGVFSTRCAALHQATLFYVTHLATHGLPWDASIADAYRGQYDAFLPEATVETLARAA